MRGGRKQALFALLALALLACTGLGRAEVAQVGRLRVSVVGNLAPRKLPRSGLAPIAVRVGGRISTTDQTLPPQLQALTIEINRHGRLDGSGLPVCPLADIQPASTKRALAACRPSLVGRGSFEADVGLSEQEPYPTRGTMLLFKGRQHGRPVLLGQIYAPHPFATSFVIVFRLRSLRDGAYGTELSATLPKALGSWGNLTALTIDLSRRYTYRGERRSFVSAGCPAPPGFSRAVFSLARTSFTFAGGRRLVARLTRSCEVRGR